MAMNNDKTVPIRVGGMLNLASWDYTGWIWGKITQKGIFLSGHQQHNYKFLKTKGIDKCKVA